ncbi:hypothetical protein [Methylobacterium oxalidis]|uniref:Uncharacterized protein n=1 Tax=Methylobacterium oxalidis TaxID=944322 RepID=A0A512IZ03_9HYPH|nr:hypothetical protein [Methylobacterium oxalidis]GEP02915.1 hypothetical protein MOX02_09530 [Methylobacterium oxalidis]GJE30298.1 hypothetical protein LDDCCGHA_0465 [Methylobacterium oxalidis]GLS65848.1 hypothetical protein GCM10007888_42300 [Methylobacterium oxalidis]
MRVVLRLAVVAWLGAGLAAGAEEPAPPRETAAKIAGLAGFVNLSCPDLRSDPVRLQAVMRSLGVEMADLELGRLRLSAQGYIEAYRRDVPRSCARAASLFGRDGTVIRGLVVPR